MEDSPLNQRSAFSHEEAFCRTLGLVTREELRTLRGKTVAIAGLGGVGGSHLLTLTRLGVGGFRIADMDRFEIQNFNRQAGANIETIGRAKSEVMTSMALAINPELRIQTFQNGVTQENLAEFFHGVDLYVDALDFFVFDVRRMVFDYCHRAGIPAITVAPIGMGAALLNFLPGKMSFDEYFRLDGVESELELGFRFLVGLTPAFPQRKSIVDRSFVSLQERRGPSTPMACELCAGVAGTEALKILLKRGKVYAAPHSIHFDAYSNRLYRRWVPWGNANPLQKFKIAMARKMLSATPETKRQDARIQATSPENPSIEELKTILTSALRAPSGDNCQPWTFQWNGDSLAISYQADRAKHPLNSGGSASLLALGCLVESSKIAASALGFEIEFKFEGLTENESKICGNIRFVRNSHVRIDSLAEWLSRRSTDRRPFKNGALPEDTLKEAALEVGSQGLTSLQVTSHPSQELVRYIIDAESLLSKHSEILPETLKWARFSKRQVENTRDGMPWRGMGVKWPDLPGLWLIRRFPSVLKFLGRIVGAQHRCNSAKLLQSSAGLYCITVSAQDPLALIEAGRIAQRAWLKLNQKGYGVQPLTLASLTVYNAHARRLDPESEERFRNLFLQGEPLLRSGFAIPEGHLPVWMFRTGLSTALPQSWETPRKEVEKVLRLIDRS